MEPRERMLAALRGEPVDRVPLEPDGLTFRKYMRMIDVWEELSPVTC